LSTFAPYLSATSAVASLESSFTTITSNGFTVWYLIEFSSFGNLLSSFLAGIIMEIDLTPFDGARHLLKNLSTLIKAHNAREKKKTLCRPSRTKALRSNKGG